MTRKFVKHSIFFMKEEININTVIVGDFNTPLTTMDRSTKQKINKETQTLNDDRNLFLVPLVVRSSSHA